VISHICNDRRSVHGVADMIDYFICFAEYLEWRGETIGNAAIDRHRREFRGIWTEIPALLLQVENQFGRRLRMSRTPSGTVLPNRRFTGAVPWIVRVHEHLTRILNDQDYRREVFDTLDRGESHQAAGYRRIVFGKTR
jgi:hypothetical protein